MTVRKLLTGTLALTVLLLQGVFYRPQPVAAATLTLGNTAVGSVTDSGDANFLNGSRFTAGASGGTVTSISVYVTTIGTSPNNKFQVGIYADSNNSPDALLASSSSGTLVANSWNTVPISATIAPGTAYWLMYNANGTASNRNNMKFSNGGSGAYSNSSVTFGTWPTTFGSSTNFSATYSIYATYTTGATATAPTVTMTAPANGATISGLQAVNANASDAVSVSGVQFKLDGINLGAEDTAEPYSVNWDTTTAGNGTHTLSAVARNPAGLTATSSVSVNVQNVVPPPPPPPSMGHPILLITDPNNAYTSYYTEILTAEGLKYYNTATLAQVNATLLGDYDLAILSEMPLTNAQATMFSDWVTAGGKLIAMRPDKKLAGLLGLTDAASALADSYLKIDSGSGPGVGIVGETIQYHGTADRYTLNGATAVATLYSNATTTTANPAVTLRGVGSNGGKAAAFTYDLARSIVLTRQGNPAWAGQQRDGIDGYEASEMFFGVGGAPDWNNLDKAIIPIADEQQRLLANMITQMDRSSKPLPRFWYFPREVKAVVVMTGDDHGSVGGTVDHFERYIAESPVGCNVNNWECIRYSTYLYTTSSLTNAQAVAYHNQGFEIGIHINTGCAPWGPASGLYTFYSSQLATWKSKYVGIPYAVSTRTHCVEWDDWSTQAKVKLTNGIRLDTDYYYYPATFTKNRPGYFNGTAIPMRYADLDGSIIDVYQSTTQMTDESGQQYAFTISTLLDKALGPEGYYAAITANMHTDNADFSGPDAIVADAKAKGVPIVSGRQMLQWLDSRNSSAFDSIQWNGSLLSFNVTGGANGLTGMLPLTTGTARLVALTRGSGNEPFSVQSVKGMQYAFFAAQAGSYTATYEVDGTNPTVIATSPLGGATGVDGRNPVKFIFSETLDPATITSASVELRNAAGALVSVTTSYDGPTNSVVLTPAAALQPFTVHTATAKAGGVKDLVGNALTTDYQVSFTTGAAAPVIIGNNQVGAQTDSGDSNYMNGSRVVNGATATSITSMSVFVRSIDAAPNNKFQLAIYTDAAGAPGTLVAVTSQGTLTGNAWNTLPISTTLASNTAYWFIYNTNSPNLNYNNMAFDAVGGQGAYSTGSVLFGSWPSNFGPRVVFNARYSIYAQ